MHVHMGTTHSLGNKGLELRTLSPAATRVKQRLGRQTAVRRPTRRVSPVQSGVERDTPGAACPLVARAVADPYGASRGAQTNVKELSRGKCEEWET